MEIKTGINVHHLLKVYNPDEFKRVCLNSVQEKANVWISQQTCKLFPLKACPSEDSVVCNM